MAASRTASGTPSIAADQVGERHAGIKRLIADRLVAWRLDRRGLELRPAPRSGRSRGDGLGSSLTRVRLGRDRSASGADAVRSRPADELPRSRPGAGSQTGRSAPCRADPVVTCSADDLVEARASGLAPRSSRLLIRSGSIPQTFRLYGRMKWSVIPAPKVRYDQSRKLAGGPAVPIVREGPFEPLGAVGVDHAKQALLDDRRAGDRTGSPETGNAGKSS